MTDAEHAPSVARLSRGLGTDDGFRPPPPPWPVKKRSPSKRLKRDCRDCGIDTSFVTGNRHYYRVRDELWAAAGMVPNGGMLCLDCLEARLGRKLVIDDFTRTPFELAASLVGKDDLAEESLRARGRDDLAEESAKARAERERDWRETRARHPDWED